MRHIPIYLYDELPTEEAKAKAREWWVDLEVQCPAWFDEHFESMHKCVELIQLERNIKKLSRMSGECEITGYCADFTLSLMIKELNRIPSESEIIQRFNKDWMEELNERIEDIAYIEENIESNRYEFTAEGRIYS